MEDSKKEQEEPKEENKDATLAEMQGLAKKLTEQEARMDAKALTLEKNTLAFNARLREAKLSGKTVSTTPGKTAEDVESDARVKAIGEATGAKWAKSM